MSSTGVNCEWARNYLPLFLYNELSFEEEEALQTHLAACADCRAALETERHFHAALDADDMPLPAGLLTACREQLSTRLAEEEKAKPSGLLDRIREWVRGFEFAPEHFLKPAGALALVAIGFFGGRIIPTQAHSADGRYFEAAVAEPVASRVRRVEPAGENQFHVVVDETRQRIFSGSPNEDQIRQLLISAASDPSDPGLRGETIEILSNVTPCDETRQALLQALETDSNDGVRLRALDGLKPIAHQSDVRRVLARVLLQDKNAGVRTKAIDLLTEGRPDMSRENDIVGVFQDLMGTEQNHYIRMRIERQLQQAKASTEVY